MSTTFAKLSALLRLSADHRDVVAVTGTRSSQLERYQHVATTARPDLGLSFNFKEAPWVIPDFRGPRNELLLRAIHFHSTGHEGHEGFKGPLLGQCFLGDTEVAIVAKLGSPAETGGGKFSQLLGRELPRWLRYQAGGDIFQLQLDKKKAVELATLFVAEPGSSSRS